MKKYLPIILFSALAFLFVFKLNAFADAPISLQGIWAQDPEVTFIGKIAARSNDFIDWVLINDGYKWMPLAAGETNPLVSFWSSFRNIVYSFLVLFVLATAFLMIINRGKNISINKFIPKFILIILFITFSFSLINFLYQITDIIQGFFINGTSSKDLLSVAFKYQDFIGFKRIDTGLEESAFVSLFLTKVTALTYYIMGGILIVRKVILWFFIIISPVLPLLFIYTPIRNTAKIWIGEFARWLLYAPIFAILLKGLIELWRSNFLTGFNFINADSSRTYPTAINILLGSPGQVVDITNSVANPNSFAQYVLALLMLWIVMLLPFILLRIFLDYAMSFSVNNSSLIKQLVGSTPLLNRLASIGPIPPPTTPPFSSQPAGIAKPLLFDNKIPSFASQGLAKQIPISQSSNFQNTINKFSNITQSSANFRGVQANSEILRLTNLSVPTMRDIARYETNTIIKDIKKHEEIARVHETLEKIANPHIVATPAEQMQYTTVRQELVSQQQKGNPVASAILSAATNASQVRGQVGKSVESFPVVNKVQSVNLDDYEAIKKLWVENYQKLDPPTSMDGKQKNRKEWIREDVDKINNVISLLLSPDKQKNKEGMQMVGSILPFLLIGGFSQTEVIAYLKAKLEAAKTNLEEIGKKEEEENTMVSADKKADEKLKEMTLEAEVKEEEKLKDPLEEKSEKVNNNNIENLKDE